MSEKLKIFPWSVSGTGMWGPTTGLDHLAKYSKGELDKTTLAGWLWKPGIDVQNTAIEELIVHGNFRQAAELARELILQHDTCEVSIREYFGKSADSLIKDNLADLPATPADYSPDKVEYIL